MKIGILGTGMVGNTLATKFVKLGHQIMMGSRTANSEAGQKWLQSVGGKAQIGTFADTAGPSGIQGPRGRIVPSTTGL